MIERGMAMIDLVNLTKRFGSVTAVDSLNVSIGEGITGLVGENGAGKSTLLRLISGVIFPDTGLIKVDGEEARSLGAKKIVFFLDDDPYSPAGSNTEGLYNFYSCFYDIDLAKYNSLIASFNLPTKQKISTFSKGMKRQAFMALSLSVNVKYLLLDEAFDGLDPLVLNLIKGETIEEREKGKNIIISSHNISTLERLVDRTIVLYKGHLAGNADARHLGEEFIKLQACFPLPINEKNIEDLGIDVVSFKKVGSICQIVVRGSEEAEKILRDKFNPSILEQVPIDPDEAITITMMAARKGNAHE